MRAKINATILYQFQYVTFQNSLGAMSEVVLDVPIGGKFLSNRRKMFSCRLEGEFDDNFTPGWTALSDCSEKWHNVQKR